MLLLLQIMAVPPTYVDLGKSAKDVFTKGYGEQHEWQKWHYVFIGLLPGRKWIWLKWEFLKVLFY